MSLFMYSHYRWGDERVGDGGDLVGGGAAGAEHVGVTYGPGNRYREPGGAGYHSRTLKFGEGLGERSLDPG